ncbi:MAG: hypothetical protein U9R57_14880 [Thermodesulfobacteriota bacterium]|nr:hypothetical protein [Thermodesulfobacteriota bacterium]
MLSACKASATPFARNDAIGCVNIAPGAPVRLGILQTLSGDVAPVGIYQPRSIELALAQRGNQLLGHQFELQDANDRCSSEGGTIAAMKVVAAPGIFTQT